MRAAVVPEIGARWEVQDVATPEPGPDQVLVRVHASGLCYTDVRITRGLEPDGGFPRTIGHEPVGEVVAVGAAVTSRREGDRVGVPWVQGSCGRCEWCLRDKRNFCPNGVATGIDAPGGHAEYMAVLAEGTMLIPDALPYEQAAPIFCAGYTVWSGLRHARPEPGERVAVQGIGGLGHLAVQYAKAAGFHTIGVTHTPEKAQLVRDLGADEVVGSGAELLEAGGADVLLSTSNSYAAAVDALEGLRPDGRLVVMGNSEEPLTLSGPQLIARRISVLGSQQNRCEHLFEALDLAARGRVRVVAETFSLEDVAEAYDRVEAGEVRFRAVVTP